VTKTGRRNRRIVVEETGILFRPDMAQRNLHSSVVPGEHLWVSMAAYRIADPANYHAGHVQHLDAENLLTVTPPGCMVCERLWSEELADTRCPGEPGSQQRIDVRPGPDAGPPINPLIRRPQ
jgi:hypothetical protein